jgi:hypothetical protein
MPRHATPLLPINSRIGNRLSSTAFLPEVVNANPAIGFVLILQPVYFG